MAEACHRAPYAISKVLPSEAVQVGSRKVGDGCFAAKPYLVPAVREALVEFRIFIGDHVFAISAEPKENRTVESGMVAVVHISRRARKSMFGAAIPEATVLRRCYGLLHASMPACLHRYHDRRT